MATEEWTGTSILYVCPLRALLNNLADRVVQYTGYVGATAGVWHGVVTASQKSAMLKHPPSVLLTTPESLEGILISANKDHVSVFGWRQGRRFDEIHAFAGDDRGWHLLFLLNRWSKSLNASISASGSLATVGNPSDLMDWLTIDCQPQNERICPWKVKSGARPTSRWTSWEILITRRRSFTDFTGARSDLCLSTADLRRRAGRKVAKSRVDTFVTHGSLSREQRMISEQAFAERQNCAIVATSVNRVGYRYWLARSSDSN